MRAAMTEMTIVFGPDEPAVFRPVRAKLTVHDEAAGPYLAVEGINDEADSNENAHQFYLCSEAEIDEFSRLAKKLLASATAFKE